MNANILHPYRARLEFCLSSQGGRCPSGDGDDRGSRLKLPPLARGEPGAPRGEGGGRLAELPPGRGEPVRRAGPPLLALGITGGRRRAEAEVRASL
jgi:hypothetical protein